MNFLVKVRLKYFILDLYGMTPIYSKKKKKKIIAFSETQI